VDQPNILFLSRDDLGWGDISFTTGQFPTPHIDSLFSNGVQLTRHYVHLMCSPSRTQFLTGRYAMNLGFGVFQPWDDSEIGGIPIGQPSIANWLSEFGHYTTYGVGKWHLGYATEQLTPTYNGFHHFYGFYQGAIDYNTKTYNDIENGDIGIYDFWEDGQPNYDIIETDTNTMYLYGDKIMEYLDTEGAKRKAFTDDQDGNTVSEPAPFFMFAALQSMHVPFPDVPEYETQCSSYLAGSTGSDQYLRGRAKYCGLLLLTDAVIGDIVWRLKTNYLWDDTLIVFTTDNGGETARGASNYPFRGTKGELFEGNTRTLTALSGGVIERAGLSGQRRTETVSNLDWTPTLLQFAGYLDCIAPDDRTWDGQSQYDLIMDYEAMEEAAKRDHLVLNVGDEALRSASMVLQHEETLYKYIRSDSQSATDRWIYSSSLADVWSTFDDDGRSLKIIEYNEGDEETRYSQVFEDGFLFDLNRDEEERFNLLDPNCPQFDAALNAVITEKAMSILSAFMAENELFSDPISMLHSRLDKGDPSLIGDGKFVRPFLSEKEYLSMIDTMFKKDSQRGKAHPGKQMRLYLNAWTCPDAVGPVEKGVAAQSLLFGAESESKGESETIVDDAVPLEADTGPLDLLGGFPDALEGGTRHNGSYSKSLAWWAKVVAILVSVLIVVVVLVTVIMFYCDRGSWTKMCCLDLGKEDHDGFGDTKMHGYGSMD